MVERICPSLMLTQAGHALAKIDRHGPRGASYVTYAEIEAMALTLATLGFPAVPTNRTIEDPEFANLSFTPTNFPALTQGARKEKDNG